MCVWQGGKNRGNAHPVKSAFEVVENVASFPLKKGCYLLLCRHSEALKCFPFMGTCINSTNIFIHVCSLLLRSVYGGDAKMSKTWKL